MMRWAEAVPRETLILLRRLEALILEESQHQNLISKSTEATIWDRHILDSLQLMDFIPERASVIDIGSGAGLPGLVLGCAGVTPLALVEPRRLRAEFLHRAADALALDVDVISRKAESVQGKHDVITGRAVAPLERFLAMTHHLSHPETIWILPKGRAAHSELAQAKRNWQGEVREEPSRTDPESTILILSKIRAKRGR